MRLKKVIIKTYHIKSLIYFMNESDGYNICGEYILVSKRGNKNVKTYGHLLNDNYIKGFYINNNNQYYILERKFYL